MALDASCRVGGTGIGAEDRTIGTQATYQSHESNVNLKEVSACKYTSHSAARRFRRHEGLGIDTA
jgi:hypothetical protein